jgi:hypothetical protein
MSIVKQVFFLFAACLMAAHVHGQATRSPFSTFGIGEGYGNALVNNQGMAGVGVSQPQFFFANHMNPALLVNNTLTVFQAGLLVEQRRITADTISETPVAGNLNYLITAFPVTWTKGKPGVRPLVRWATSLSLTPYSTVKYKLGYIEDITGSTDQVEITEEGSGGISQFSWSNGIRLTNSSTNNLSIGLKTSYLFGSIVNTYKNQLIDSSQPANFIAAIEERSYVKDFAFSAGVSYSLDSILHKKRYRLSFGAVYDLATDLKTRNRNLIYRTTAVGDVIDPDTLGSSTGKISLPSGLTGGVSLSKGAQWSIGTQFSYRDWSSFRSVNRDDEGLQKSWSVALGGEATPDLFSENYLKRVTYRLGASMEEYPFLANGRKVQDLGINFGFSLPAGRSSLDFAFRYGTRGDKTDNLIQENYFRVFFGITFNDQWFIKRKFE